METMTSRERLRILFSGGTPDRCGFWLGCPHADTWPIYHRHFGTSGELDLRRRLGDDFRWICPQWTAYRHPQGRPIFYLRREEAGLAAGSADGNFETLDEVEAFPWPDPEHLDFTAALSELRSAGEVYRASGFWCPFFHDLAAFFGMENYFVKMYTHPEVVHAATRRVVDFYLEANRRFFERAGDEVDGFFFGNDFGTQRGLLLSPDLFDAFVLPYFRELVDAAHGFGLQVILHSCGAVARVIPRIIAMGVHALHPLQALAEGMAAERLAAEFKGRIAFMGGVDTQRLLVQGTPDEIRADVRRVKSLLGPNLVVSPSHEALLPNVPPANVAAMAEAARE